MSFTSTISKKIGAAWLAAFMVLASAGIASAQTGPEAAAKGISWARTQQQPDGSFAGFGAGSTVDAVLALVAAGEDPRAGAPGGKSAVEFLESKVADLAKTPGGAGKLVIGVVASGRDPRAFGGVNLVNTINAGYNAGTGQYGGDAIGHAFAILGLDAAAEDVPQKAVTALESLQTPEGGWAFSGETKAGGADTNTTAVAVQALVAVGETTSTAALTQAAAYLESQQNADGGFPYQQGGEFGSESDVNSTSYVVQAAIALGNRAMASEGSAFLLSMQKPSGAFQWTKSEPDDNAGATYQAIPALAGMTLILTGTPTQTTLQPGMPTTGMERLPVGIAAMTALALLMLCLGMAARRTTSL